MVRSHPRKIPHLAVSFFRSLGQDLLVNKRQLLEAHGPEGPLQHG